MKTSQEYDWDYSPSPLAESPALRDRIPMECAGLRLDASLAQVFPEHSRSRLQDWLKQGVILIDGAHLTGKSKVMGGERIDFSTAVSVASDATHAMSATALALAAEDIPLTVVFEDDQLLVIDKPAGLVVHPGNGNGSGTLMNALLYHAPQLAEIPRAGIVHRLDKETGGLLVVAKTLIAQTDLVRQLQARTVKRQYLALALGVVSRSSTIDAPMGRHPVHRTKMAVVREGSPGSKDARTHYVIRERFAKSTLLECQLETGRTHQIRVHLASIGHPLAGDPAYGKTCSGDPRLDAFKRQALHAWRLALVHPVSDLDMEWESPIPEDFSSLLDELRNT